MYRNSAPSRPPDPEFGEHVGGRARAVAHLRECHRGTCDRHHDAVTELFGTLIEHGRNGQTARGHYTLAAAGSGAPSAAYPKSSADGSVPG